MHNLSIVNIFLAKTGVSIDVKFLEGISWSFESLKRLIVLLCSAFT